MFDCLYLLDLNILKSTYNFCINKSIYSRYRLVSSSIRRWIIASGCHYLQPQKGSSIPCSQGSTYGASNPSNFEHGPQSMSHAICLDSCLLYSWAGQTSQFGSWWIRGEFLRYSRSCPGDWAALAVSLSGTRHHCSQRVGHLSHFKLHEPKLIDNWQPINPG